MEETPSLNNSSIINPLQVVFSDEPQSVDVSDTSKSCLPQPLPGSESEEAGMKDVPGATREKVPLSQTVGEATDLGNVMCELENSRTRGAEGQIWQNAPVVEPPGSRGDIPRSLRRTTTSAPETCLGYSDLTPPSLEPYACTSCAKSFATTNSLEKHLQRLHLAEIPFVCTEDGEYFSRESDYMAHMKLHPGFDYTCAVCTKGFKNYLDFSSHMRSHTGAKPFSCAMCRHSFTETADLRRHVKLHAEGQLEFNGSQYHCKRCSKTFLSLFEIERHMKSHGGQRRGYLCSMCPRTFLILANLQKHMQMHAGLAVHKCHKCLREFPGLGIFQDHLKVCVAGAPNGSPESDVVVEQTAPTIVPMSEQPQLPAAGQYNANQSFQASMPPVSTQYNMGGVYEAPMISQYHPVPAFIPAMPMVAGPYHPSQTFQPPLPFVAGGYHMRPTFGQPMYLQGQTFVQPMPFAANHPYSGQTQELPVRPLTTPYQSDEVICIPDDDELIEKDVSQDQPLEPVGIEQEIPVPDATVDKDQDVIVSYPCTQCGEIFDREESRNTHKEIHTEVVLNERLVGIHMGNDSYKCNSCQKEIAGLSSFKTHATTCAVIEIDIATTGAEIKTEPKPEEEDQSEPTNPAMIQHEDGISSELVPMSEVWEPSGNMTADDSQVISSQISNATYESTSLCESTQTLSTVESISRVEDDTPSQHVEVEDAEKSSFPCSQCGKCLVGQKAFIKHVAMHPAWKMFACPFCYKMFPRRYLGLHLTTHTGVRPFQCDKCTRSFLRLDRLKDHAMTHEDPTTTISRDGRKKRCRLCNKFVTRHYFDLHMTTHTGKRPFKCDKCPQSYIRGDRLREHMKVHTGVAKVKKPSALTKSKISKVDGCYKCVTCAETCENESAFIDHICSHISGKILSCPFCVYQSYWIWNYRRHLWLHMPHGGAVQKLDRTGYNTRTVAKSNRKTILRNYPIPNSKKWTVVKMKNKNATLPNILKCSICEELCNGGSAFIDHCLSHMIGKKTKCPLCKFKSKWKCNLRRHLQSHVNEMVTQSNKVLGTITALEHATQNSEAAESEAEIVPSSANVTSEEVKLNKTCDVNSNSEQSFNVSETSHKPAHVIPAIAVHNPTDSDGRTLVCGVCQEYCDQQTFVEHMMTHVDKKQLQFPLCHHHGADKKDLARHLDWHVKEKSCESSDISTQIGIKQESISEQKQLSEVSTVAEDMSNISDTSPNEIQIDVVTSDDKELVRSDLHCGQPSTPITSTHISGQMLAVGAETGDEHTASTESTTMSVGHELILDRDDVDNVEEEEEYYMDLKTTACSFCDETFSDELALDIHMSEHVGNKFNVCQICGKIFKDAELYDMHLLAHKKEKRHTCTVCQRTFPQRDRLRNHFEIHVGQKSYHCCICDRGHIRLNKLTNHMKAHADVDKMQCRICKLKFGLLKQVLDHLMLHTCSMRPKSMKILSKNTPETEANCEFPCKTGSTVDVDEACVKVSTSIDRSSLQHGVLDSSAGQANKRALNPPRETRSCLSSTVSVDGKYSNKTGKYVKSVPQYEEEGAHRLPCDPSDIAETGELQRAFVESSTEIEGDTRKTPGDLSTGLNSANENVNSPTHEKPSRVLGSNIKICQDIVGKEADIESDTILSKETEDGTVLLGCGICGVFCETDGALVNHLALHTGVDNLTCLICSKESTRNYNHRRHVRMHVDHTRMISELRKVAANTTPSNSGETADLRKEQSTWPEPVSIVAQSKSELCKLEENKSPSVKTVSEPLQSIHITTGCGDGMPNAGSSKVGVVQGYACRLCEKVFSRQPLVINHMVDSHPDVDRWPCPLCRKSFARVASFQLHLQIHSGVKQYSCALCSQIFFHPDYLRVHMKTHGGAILRLCKICLIGFDNERSRREHMLIHTNGIQSNFTSPVIADTRPQPWWQPVDLEVGGEETTSVLYANVGDCHDGVSSGNMELSITDSDTYSLRDLSADSAVIDLSSGSPASPEACPLVVMPTGYSSGDITMATVSVSNNVISPDKASKKMSDTYSVSDESPTEKTNGRVRRKYRKRVQLPCYWCKEVFDLRIKFNRHTMEHMKETGIICPVCKKSFEKPLGLHRHMLIHTGEKRYRCDYCARDFGRVDHLRQHEVVHTQIKPFACKICSRRFRLSSQLKFHMKRHEKRNRKNCANSVMDESGNCIEFQEENVDGDIMMGESANMRFASEQGTDEECEVVGYMADPKSRLNLEVGPVNGELFSPSKAPPHISTVEDQLVRNGLHVENPPEKHSADPLEVLFYDQEQNITLKQEKFDPEIQSSMRLPSYDAARLDGGNQGDCRDNLFPKEYRCLACQETHACWESLLEHVKTHATEKLYCCGICFEKFYSSENLAEHISVHTDEGQGQICGSGETRDVIRENGVNVKEEMPDDVGVLM